MCAETVVRPDDLQRADIRFVEIDGLRPANRGLAPNFYKCGRFEKASRRLQRFPLSDTHHAIGVAAIAQHLIADLARIVTHLAGRGDR